MSALQAGGVIGAAILLGLGVPWLGMRMLVPSLRDSRTLDNYRGCPVFSGLGIVWLLWAGAAIIGGVLASWIHADGALSVVPILTLAGPLALVAFGLGVVDDAYGTGTSRGFRGHLSALRRGRLTTGGMKLFGVSLASFIIASFMVQFSPWGVGPDVGFSAAPALSIALSLAGGAAIALTSNFVNLTDLRPGRALKVYSVLAVAGVVSTALLLGSYGVGSGEGGVLDPAVAPGVLAIDALALLIFVLGPVLAVWPYDLGEQGMLGDAGANPMGAVAGMLIVAGLPRWGLFGYLGLMLALNLASERVSFSKVIEGNGALSWLDGLGRSPE